MDGPRKKAGLLMLLLLLPAQLMASDQMLEVGLGVDAQWFDWREYRGNQQLLVESGPIALGRGDVRLQVHDFYGRYSFGLGGGKAHYDGQLQNGTPYQSDAWELIAENEGQLGIQRDWGNLHIGLMQRNWDRKIDGSNTVSSVHEVYRWRLMVIGGEVNLLQTPSLKMGLTVDYGYPFDSWQKVYSDFFGDFNLEPGDGYFWRIAMPIRKGAWELTPFVQQQTMDVSNSVQRRPVSGGALYSIVQPASDRTEGGLRLRYVLGGRIVTDPAPANIGETP